MNVWILQTGEPLHIDESNQRPMRAMNLANALVDRGHEVTLWSSAFYHQEKRHRCRANKRVQISDSLEIRLVYSPGYKKNIGFARLLDHAVLARNLKILLNSEIVTPDVAFIGYPPIEIAAVMTKWLSARKVPCMVDVKDQWPSIFINALPSILKPLGRLALAPYFYLGRRALQNAVALSAMADGFLNWAAGFEGRTVCDWDRVVPLTTPTSKISHIELRDAENWWSQRGVYADGTQRICFIGSHSQAFDMEPVFQAASSMASLGSTCQFVICGDGENTSVWKKKVAHLSNVLFVGWIDRAKIEALALRSCAALAPYKNTEDFMLSVPNKVIDYLSLGLPVLSPLSGEVRNLILDFDIGLSYGPVAEKTLESCIQDLGANSELRKIISSNALKLFQSRFSFEIVYGGLVKHLEMLAYKRRK
jgi:glycosyltransferase involved in cell wall biosynthesis